MKSGCIRIGTIAGIPLELHFSWAIIFALLAWSLATATFPRWSPICRRAASGPRAPWRPCFFSPRSWPMIWAMRWWPVARV